jgi:hypothetical protein
MRSSFTPLTRSNYGLIACNSARFFYQYNNYFFSSLPNGQHKVSPFCCCSIQRKNTKNKTRIRDGRDGALIAVRVGAKINQPIDEKIPITLFTSNEKNLTLKS